MISKSSKKKNPRRRGKNQREDVGAVVPVNFKMRSSNFLSRHIGGVPQTQRTTFVWSAFTQNATSSATYFENTVILNSPLAPGGTTAAEGFAKMMAFYSKCFVIRTRWRVLLQHNLSTGGFPNVDPCEVGAVITTTSTSLASPDAAIMNGLSQHDFVTVNPDHVSFEGELDIGRYLNKPDILDDDQLYTTASANPTALVFMHAWVFNNGPSVGNLTTRFVLEFDCVLTDPIHFS
jgi:hypothetical protein